MIKINLLPPEIYERGKGAKRFLLIVPLLILVAMIIATVVIIMEGQIRDARDNLNAQNVILNRVRVEVSQLQIYEQRKKELEEWTKVLKDIMQYQVFWSKILNEVSMIIPSDVWLTSFSGTVALTAPTAPTPTPTPSTTPTGTAPTTPTKTAPTTPGAAGKGEIDFRGSTFDYASVANWLATMVQIEDFTNIWFVSSVKRLMSVTGTVPGAGTTGEFYIVDFEIKTQLVPYTVKRAEEVP